MGTSGQSAVRGLLLGREAAETREVVVEDSIALTAGDFAEKMSKWAPGEGKRIWAVGYYQHQSNGQLALQDDDVALFQREFPGAGYVMLVSALEGGRPVAGFVERVGAEIPRQPLQPFPLSRTELLQAMDRADGPPDAPAVAALPHPPRPRRFTQHDAIRWTSAAIVLLALAVIGIGQYSKPAGPRAPADDAVAQPAGPELQLTLEGTPERVVLKWNRRAPAITQSVEGALSITEGGRTQILMLKPADLAAGSVVYFPKSADAAFQLEVTTANGQRVSERTHFVSGRQDELTQ